MDLLVRIVVNSLIASSVGVLLASAYYAVRGRPYAPRRDPRRLALASLFTAALGVAGHLAIRGAAPVPDAPPIVTETRFESARVPALAIDAPPDWRLEYDAAKRMVRLRKEAASIEAAPSTLTLDSSVLEDEAVLDRLIGAVRSAFESKGAKVEAPFADTIAGADARGLVVRFERGELCSWIVKRGRRFLTSVQCFSGDGATCRAACAEPLARLRWMKPSNVAPADL
jgi:hypothetical protein